MYGLKRKLFKYYLKYSRGCFLWVVCSAIFLYVHKKFFNTKPMPSLSLVKPLFPALINPPPPLPTPPCRSYVSGVMCHVPGVTCHVLHIPCHLSHVSNASSHSHGPYHPLCTAGSIANNQQFILDFRVSLNPNCKFWYHVFFYVGNLFVIDYFNTQQSTDMATYIRKRLRGRFSARKTINTRKTQEKLITVNML